MTDVPVILVTGAARRIGAGMLRALHARGCDVVIHYRHSADAARALREDLCAKRADSAHAVSGDLSSAAGCAAVVQAARAWRGRLDGLVNNASTFVRSDLGHVDETHWAYLMDGNLKAAFFCSQAAAAALCESRGAIVNVCDVRTDRPLPGFSVYTAAKAGMVSLTRSLALELAPHVRVNALSPGSLTWPEDDTFSAHERARIEAAIPLARIGDGADMGQVAFFLLREAHYVTGQVIAVDGGAGLASPQVFSMIERFPDCYRMLVQGVEVECLLGVYEHEQRQPRRVGIEVELYVPVTEPAAREDRLSGTVNYEAVMAAIARITTSRRFKLVESLCSSLLDDLAQLPGVRALRVAIIKPHPMPGLGSVRIEQWREL